MLASSVVFFVLAAALTGGPPGAGPSDRTGLADPSGFSLSETSSMRVATRTHVGPYWRLGEILEQVRGTMIAQGASGPIVVRFLDDPMRTLPKDLRSEIGFVVSEGDEVPEIFTVSVRPPELVVALKVQGPHRYSARHLRLLQGWADRQGLSPVGPVIEIVHFPADDSPEGVMNFEIQLPVCEKEPESAPSGVLENSIETDQIGQATVSDSPSSVRPGASGAQATREDAKSVGSRRPIQATLDRKAERDEEGHPSNTETAPARTGPLGGEHRAAKSDRDNAVDRLIAEGRFEELARTLLLDDVSTTDPDRVWMHQVVLRVNAIARGVQRQFPGKEGWLIPLSNALTQRSERLSSAKGSPKEGAGRQRTATSNAVPAEAKKSITRRLELLMGRVAVGSVEAEGAKADLAGLLQEAQDLLVDDQP